MYKHRDFLIESENIINKRIFEKELPKWGGNFINENSLKSIVKITNTSSFRE
jgi:hypothetical protein